MNYTAIGDLALPEDAVARQITGTLAVDIREQADSSIQMFKVMLCLGDLRLIGVDPSMNFGAFVLQSLKNQGI